MSSAPEWISAGATVVSVGVADWYATLTHRIARSGGEQMEELKAVRLERDNRLAEELREQAEQILSRVGGLPPEVGQLDDQDLKDLTSRLGADLSSLGLALGGEAAKLTLEMAKALDTLWGISYELEHVKGGPIPTELRNEYETACRALLFNGVSLQTYLPEELSRRGKALGARQ